VARFFRGSHWWTLEALPSGGTRLVHGAEMAGWVVPFLQDTMDATRAGYVAFNAALAAEVEARDGGNCKRQPGPPSAVPVA
jgi:hypothetical protein